jgi:hypothetical protein
MIKTVNQCSIYEPGKGNEYACSQVVGSEVA